MTKAISDLDQAIKLNSRLIEAYYNRGFALRGKGDKEGHCGISTMRSPSIRDRQWRILAEAWFGPIWKTWNKR